MSIRGGQTGEKCSRGIPNKCPAGVERARDERGARGEFKGRTQTWRGEKVFYLTSIDKASRNKT